MEPKEENCLDSQLWHACAGSMVQMPPVNSSVFYFPQGHSEHASGYVDFRKCPRVPAYIPCRVSAVKFLADRETDEVFAKIRLVPVNGNELGFDDNEGATVSGSGNQDKPTSFAKTLTQSDANNGGGFSVPRYCAETIFPRLDYNADPPVQTIIAKDVHGETWKFRHIYRGTPRRHLLTTGWSTFVNHKSLVAGDSIVFMRAENGDLCVGIRRAKKGIGSGLEMPTWWNSACGNPGMQCGGISAFLGEDEGKLSRHNESWVNRGRVKAEDVVQAATLVAGGQPFEVIYYPRASTPEFCVKASQVKVALQICWSPGMRFKMAFETEDSSRISWFMGTISAVKVADPILWPDSPWRLLQVSWDEPDLLQNVKRVSPWLVELVSNVHGIPFSFSHPGKKIRLPHQEFPLGGQIFLPSFSSQHVLRPNNIFGCVPISSPPAGMQGARHAQYGFSASYFQQSKQPSPISSACFMPLDSFPLSSQASNPVVPIHERDENISCLLTMGNSALQCTKSDDSKSPLAPTTTSFVLFGQPILTDSKISLGCLNDAASPTRTSNSSSDNKFGNTSDGSGSGSGFALYQNKTQVPSASASPSPSEALTDGLCKVFLESDDVGRTVDLSSVNCYEELHSKLQDLFSIEAQKTSNIVVYRDAAGAIRKLGDEPFGTFMRSSRRLTILTEPSRNNMNLGVSSSDVNNFLQ